MAWRKWLVRGLVFTVLASVAGGGWIYQSWTSPQSVRRLLVDRLEEQFAGARVHLERAGLRLLGGISFHDLRMVRRDDPEEHEILHVPHGVIYHDKEQLLNGKLMARKIELERPRIHLLRRPDGAWNLAGILGQVDPREPIPTLVIRQGTLVFEDQQAGAGQAPVAIQNVDGTLLNDPLTVLVFQARGQNDLTGAVALRGQCHRDTWALELTVEAADVPLSHALVERLGCYCTSICLPDRQVEGTARLEVRLRHDPAAARPWSHAAQAHLRKGKLRHPLIPLPLEEIDARLECSDGRLVLHEASARAGRTTLAASGWVLEPFEAGDLHAELRVRDLELTPELFGRLPAELQVIQRDFAPRGLVHVDARFDRKNGAWHRHSIVRAQDVSAAYVKFPYRVEHLRGTVEHQCDPERGTDLRRLDLLAEADGRPVHIRGEIRDAHSEPAVHVDVWGEGVPITERLLEALPARYQALARSFHPTGVGDFVARLRKRAGDKDHANHITLRMHQGTVCYDVFPYPLENVSGVLDIYPHHWEVRDVSGTHQGCTMRCFGRSDAPDQDPRVRIVIQAENLLLDEELEAALGPWLPGLQAAWRTFAPSGRMNLIAQVEQSAERPDDIAVAVTAQGVRICPTFLPYPLDDVSGTVRYADGRVDLEGFRGRHGTSRFSLDKGEVYLKPGGGFWAKAGGLRGAPLVADADLIRALPPILRSLAVALNLKTPIDFTTELVVDWSGLPGTAPTIYWDGGAVLRDAAFRAGVPLEQVHGQAWCRGRHNGVCLEGLAGNVVLSQASLFGQPVRDLHARVEVVKDEPEVLRVPDLKAKLFGGDVGGQARVEFGPTIHYDVNLTAMQVKLEEFGRHNFGNQVEYSGLASARLYLSGQGADIEGLDGKGAIEVPNGRLYNLPLLLDLLKVLGLRPPDRTAFEEAYAQFSIRGPQVAIQRLDLYGNAISLSGEGQMNLDGSGIELDFYAVWGRVMQILPPMLRPLPTAVSQHLLRLKMRGKVEKVEITKEPVPILVDNLEKFLERAAKRHQEWRDLRQAGSRGRER